MRKLIAGPNVFICDECVELCNDIIREEMEENAPVVASKRLSHTTSIRFSMNT